MWWDNNYIVDAIKEFWVLHFINFTHFFKEKSHSHAYKQTMGVKCPNRYGYLCVLLGLLLFSFNFPLKLFRSSGGVGLKCFTCTIVEFLTKILECTWTVSNIKTFFVIEKYSLCNKAASDERRWRLICPMNNVYKYIFVQNLLRLRKNNAMGF